MVKKGGQMTTLLLAVVIFVNLGAGDLTGFWTFIMNDFCGHPRSFDCTFKQEGTK
jgi:hypothetical protein